MKYWTNQGISVFAYGKKASCLNARDYKFVRDIVQMEWKCCGNGQLHQMSMMPMTNTLDCMHDQQFIMGGGYYGYGRNKQKEVCSAPLNAA